MISARNQSILDIINSHGGSVTWTNQELADYLGIGVSVTRISVAVRQLTDQGHLVVERTAPHPKSNKSGRILKTIEAAPF